MSKADKFKGKNFLLIHGTADGTLLKIIIT